MVCTCMRFLSTVSEHRLSGYGLPSTRRGLGLAARLSSFVTALKAPPRLGLVMGKVSLVLSLGLQGFAAGLTMRYADPPALSTFQPLGVARTPSLVRITTLPTFLLEADNNALILNWPSCLAVSHSLLGAPFLGVGSTHAQCLLSSVESHTSHSAGGRSRFLPAFERPPGYMPCARLWAWPMRVGLTRRTTCHRTTRPRAIRVP